MRKSNNKLSRLVDFISTKCDDSIKEIEHFLKNKNYDSHEFFVFYGDDFINGKFLLDKDQLIYTIKDNSCYDLVVYSMFSDKQIFYKVEVELFYG